MKDEKKIDSKKVNEIINSGNKILHILYILFIILLVYVITLIVREWNILAFLGKIISLISPLFIGWFIAWFLHPLAKKINSKGLGKGLSVTCAYLIMLIVVGLVIAFTLPSLSTQISDIVSTVPKIANDRNNNNVYIFPPLFLASIVFYWGIFSIIWECIIVIYTT